MFLANNNKKGLALVPLAQASTAPDPSSKPDDNDDAALVTIQGQALIAGTSPVKKDPEEDGGVNIYEVQSGDTVSGIAAKFHITANTILWANAIDNIDSIMPGDKIFILPVAGLSYTVQKGDNIDSIAKKYKADKDKIIAYNDLPATGELKEGEDIMIPDGQKDVPAPVPTPSSGSSIAARPYESFPSTPGKSTLSGSAGKGHGFPYGYCTWYVAQHRYIPWSGNAGTWLYHAKSMGYSTGHTPKVGAIMVSSESWWGHVALVKSVSSDGTFTVSEMNVRGWAKVDYRVISTGSRAIKGFIY